MPTTKMSTALLLLLIVLTQIYSEESVFEKCLSMETHFHEKEIAALIRAHKEGENENEREEMWSHALRGGYLSIIEAFRDIGQDIDKKVNDIRPLKTALENIPLTKENLKRIMSIGWDFKKVDQEEPLLYEILRNRAEMIRWSIPEKNDSAHDIKEREIYRETLKESLATIESLIDSQNNYHKTY